MMGTMKKLAWTIEKPQQSGWYWWRLNSEETPTILQVDVETEEVYLGGSEVPLSVEGGQWAGPLEPPL